MPTFCEASELKKQGTTIERGTWSEMAIPNNTVFLTFHFFIIKYKTMKHFIAYFETYQIHCAESSSE